VRCSIVRMREKEGKATFRWIERQSTFERI
jgi:hypothetical protein